MDREELAQKILFLTGQKQIGADRGDEE